MAQVFLTICLLVLGLTVGWTGAEAEQAGPAEESPPAVTLRTLITGTCQEVQRYAESLVGSGVIRSAAEFFQMVIRFLAEGAASGLNVIAVMSQRSSGSQDSMVETLTLPRFTPEGVTAIAQWGLVALIGYWVLTIVPPSDDLRDTTAVRLGGLVLGCVLLTLLTSGSEKTCSVDNRLSSLEGRLKARREEERGIVSGEGGGARS
ncbi:hypothetical protein GBF38_000503 [Nibea albiflora]|nr:hypothetical protein GBF38_000503 [Nibea albiflora]